MKEAFGIIETYGLISAVRACDAALKSANIVLESVNYVRGGIVSVTFRGDVGAVKAGVDSGVSEGNRDGMVLSSSIIPRLDIQVEKIVSKEIKNIPVSSENKTAKVNTDNNKANKLEEEKRQAEMRKAEEDRKSLEIRKQKEHEEKLKFEEENRKLEELKRKTEELKKAEEDRKVKEDAAKKPEPPKPNNNNKSGGSNNKKKGKR